MRDCFTSFSIFLVILVICSLVDDTSSAQYVVKKQQKSSQSSSEKSSSSSSEKSSQSSSESSVSYTHTSTSKSSQPISEDRINQILSQMQQKQFKGKDLNSIGDQNQYQRMERQLNKILQDQLFKSLKRQNQNRYLSLATDEHIKQAVNSYKIKNQPKFKKQILKHASQNTKKATNSTYLFTCAIKHLASQKNILKDMVYELCIVQGVSIAELYITVQQSLGSTHIIGSIIGYLKYGAYYFFSKKGDQDNTDLSKSYNSDIKSGQF